MARFSFSLLSTLFLCLAIHSYAATEQQDVQTPTHGSNLINVACQRAAQKQYCIDLINSDSSTPTADIKGFAVNALKASEKNAATASVITKRSLNKPGMDSQPGLQQALNDCSDQYIDAVELIGDSVSALLSNDKDDVHKFMKSAIADVDTCDASIKDYDVVSKEMTKTNSDLRLLFSTSLDIVDAIEVQN